MNNKKTGVKANIGIDFERSEYSIDFIKRCKTKTVQNVLPNKTSQNVKLISGRKNPNKRIGSVNGMAKKLLKTKQ